MPPLLNPMTPMRAGSTRGSFCKCPSATRTSSGDLQGMRGIFFIQVLQSLVVGGGGKISPSGKVQADSLHVAGKRTSVGVNQDGGQRPLSLRIPGQPVHSKLAMVKKSALPVNPRCRFQGVKQEIVRHTPSQGKRRSPAIHLHLEEENMALIPTTPSIQRS